MVFALRLGTQLALAVKVLLRRRPHVYYKIERLSSFPSSMLKFPFSKSVLSTISPPIPAAYKWITKSCRPLLDMSQGVPGTPPHPMLQEALAQTGNAWGYCPAEGEHVLREALAKEMKSIYGTTKDDRNVDITSSDIAITSGCNLAFVATIMAIADAGDEVILPIPWYFNHHMTLTLLGIHPVPLFTSASDGFLPSSSLAAQLIKPGKTRAIALVTPNNPTGAVYPPELLREFADLASKSGIALILDETYRDFIVPETLDLKKRVPHFLFNNSPLDSSWRTHLISLYSFSKSYRIPSQRLGAITASPVLLTQIVKILDTLQICAPRAPQIALSSIVPVTNGSDPSGEPVSLLSHLHHDIVSTSIAIHLRHALFKSTLSTEAPRWKIASQGTCSFTFLILRFYTFYFLVAQVHTMHLSNILSLDIPQRKYVSGLWRRWGCEYYQRRSLVEIQVIKLVANKVWLIDIYGSPLRISTTTA